MRRLEHRRTALAGAVLAAICCVGYVGASFVAVAGAGSLTGTTATESTPEPQPSPDPAPIPPKPAPKPVSKPTPAPAPVRPTPSHVSTSPVQQSPQQTSAPTPTRTPARTNASKGVQGARLTHQRRHKRPRPTPAPAPTRATPDVAVGPKHASLGVAPATASISSADTGRSALVIAGLALASLMFLTVAAVPAAGTRFTSADRVLMYHRTGLLAAGVGTLLVTALVFFIARGA